MKSQEIGELSTALAKAQSEIQSAKKQVENLYFGKMYADLASVWDACRAPLSKNGLSVIQVNDHDALGPCVITLLCHTSGQWVESRLHLILTKQDMQGLGSAITYARRYSLAAIAGIAQVDDDAEEAVDRQPMAPPAQIRMQTGPVIAQNSASEVPSCCGGQMLVSRYNPNEIYCPKCKNKRARAA